MMHDTRRDGAASDSDDANEGSDGPAEAHHRHHHHRGNNDGPRQDGEGSDDFYRETFRAMDSQKTGTVTISEFQLGTDIRTRSDLLPADLEEVHPHNPSDDDDGVLDEDDFVALMNDGEVQEFFSREQDMEDEMLVMDFRDVYGRCPPALDEDDRMVRRAIDDMKAELDGIPEKRKGAFARARSECPGLIDDDFLLLFLRCDLFDPAAAAARCARYWEGRLRAFGPSAAFRPLTLSNAFGDGDRLPPELTLGHERVTGVKDPGGRPVVYVDFTVEDKRRYDAASLVRSWWYVLHAVLEDVDAQRHGVVFLVNNRIDNLLKADLQVTYEMCRSLSSNGGGIPMRLLAVHMVRPHSRVAWILGVGKLYLGSELRKRFHVHDEGDDRLLLAGLAVYGLTRDKVPSVWGGDLELPDHGRWIAERREKGL